MLRNKILSIPFALIFALSVLFVGCGTGSDGETGRMTVQMHDAPIDSADAVNVFVERVEINNQENEEGWTVLSEPQNTYNLLELTNGAMAELASSELPTGRYEQIRLILSRDGHSVVVDGKDHSMTVPSGSETGIKLNVNAEIQEDIEYVLLLDFDASRSVVKAGQSGMYLLKPVIKATNQAVTGNIEGTVEPVEAEPVVFAIAGSDTLASTVADTSNGEFKLIGLEEGTYDVSVNPRNDSYQTENIEGVSVTVDETTGVGTVQLNQ
jgi:hypothetical protein